jgi:isopentenyl-diphosphate delta-isomerase
MEAAQSPGSLAQRKADHLSLCADGDVGFRGKTTLFEEVELVHCALPELAWDAVDPRTVILGKSLAAPLLIAAMTGGTEEAGRVNRTLAELAEAHGIGFGLGSQRAMHVRPDTAATFRVRDVAPTTLVLGNVGIVQATHMSNDELAALVGSVGADALCIHLNPAMELVQPGGDRDFGRGLETLARAQQALSVPVVVKETGCGIGRPLGERLAAMGIRDLDVSGAGGTSWVAVETHRAGAEGADTAQRLGELFWDWGIPTAACVASLAPLGLRTVFATGGIFNGLDVARALALGATGAGIARGALQALRKGGRSGADSFLKAVVTELRASMLLTGSRTPADLRRARRVLGPRLQSYVAALMAD